MSENFLSGAGKTVNQPWFAIVIVHSESPIGLQHPADGRHSLLGEKERLQPDL